MAEQKTILIVDDDPDLVEATKIVLESAGYAVESASDGKTGVQKAKEIKPALIIMDVMMGSDTEGFHATYKLREDPDLAKTPILMLTSISQKTGMKFSPDTDKEYLPVDEFVEKPIAPQDLLKKVKALLKDE